MLLTRDTGEGLFRPREEEFRGHIEILVPRVDEEGEGRFGAIGFLDADKEGLILFKDYSHDIEGIKTTIHNKDALLGHGIAADQRDGGVFFIDEGARLDNGVEIAIVAEMVHDIDVQLMITALTGIIRDEGGVIRSMRSIPRDVLIRAVNVIISKTEMRKMRLHKMSTKSIAF